jgi:hypothetical protein
MSDAGNRVIDALTLVITDMLVATFGSNRKATTDLNIEPEKYPAEATPLVYVERGALGLSGDGYWQTEAKVELHGLIKPTAATAAKLQTEVLRLEEMFFGLIGAGQLGGVEVEIAPDGDDTPFVGEKDAILVFPIVIKYARGA